MVAIAQAARTERCVPDAAGESEGARTTGTVLSGSDRARRLAGTDARLVRAARTGDVEAFELLVGRHADMTYRVALRMLANPADAEDAAQDALVRAWRGMRRFRGESTFATWLCRLVINRCLDARAARRDNVPLHDTHPAHGTGAAEVAESRARFAAVTRAIGALSTEQRGVLVLRELEGLSYEQTAAVLEISAGAVKGRLHRARVELAEQMRGWA